MSLYRPTNLTSCWKRGSRIANEADDTLTTLGEEKLDCYLHRPAQRRPFPALEEEMLHSVDAALVAKDRRRIGVRVVIATV